MDDDAREALLDAAMEAYWAADGGTRGGLSAALAVIEPVVREDCAMVAKTHIQKTHGMVIAQKAHGMIIAAAIRRGIND